MSSTQDKEQVVLDSWGYTTPETLEARRERTKKWKPALLELAEQVHQAMLQFKPDPQSKLKAQWYISDGSLLGAFRNGAMISHDYDFDYGICFLTEEGHVANCEESKTQLHSVADHLSSSLDKKYTILPRDGFAFKIEIYQESSGVHWDNKGKWYNVHMDLQMCFSPDQNKFIYAYFRDDYNDYIDIKVSDVIPLCDIEFESKRWPCPCKPENYLKGVYGYIGTPAKYNSVTRKYEPLEESWTYC